MAVIRATRDGLTIQLGDGDFASVLNQLVEKLSRSESFFHGSQLIPVVVDPGVHTLTAEQVEQLRSLLAQYDLRLSGILMRVFPTKLPSSGSTAKEDALAPTPLEVAPELGSSTQVVTRTLRSGQSVRHTGDVIVLGDVNPGAEVVATGHIVVMGALKGLAHAGATGYMEAIVVASKLRPTQLRIGAMIARSPDDTPRDEESTGALYPEVAKVVDNRIEIVRAK